MVTPQNLKKIVVALNANNFMDIKVEAYNFLTR